MQYSKPVISNQHGALVMALLPFLYAQFAEHHQAGFYHLSFGLAWFSFISSLILFLQILVKNRPLETVNGQLFILR